jgi:hypothetical protein
MPRYYCIRGVILPDPEHPDSPRGRRYLKGEVFEAEPPTRPVTTRGSRGLLTLDWLDWAEARGVIRKTDGATTGPGRESGEYFPVEKFRPDGSVEEPEPEMEHID